MNDTRVVRRLDDVYVYVPLNLSDGRSVASDFLTYLEPGLLGILGQEFLTHRATLLGRDYKVYHFTPGRRIEEPALNQVDALITRALQYEAAGEPAPDPERYPGQPLTVEEMADKMGLVYSPDNKWWAYAGKYYTEHPRVLSIPDGYAAFVPGRASPLVNMVDLHKAMSTLYQWWLNNPDWEENYASRT